MATVWNIRGTNGSGKSTLARAFKGEPIGLNPYDAPTKYELGRQKIAQGYLLNDPGLTVIGLVGPYETPTGGLDQLPSFAVQQEAIRHIIDRRGAQQVICEGVLASTVAGSWFTFADEMAARGHALALVYLHTPLAVCLDRIKARQVAAGRVRDIKEDLVADKVRAIFATRDKALHAGRLVYDIPYDPIPNGGREAEAMRMIMAGEGEVYRAR